MFARDDLDALARVYVGTVKAFKSTEATLCRSLDALAAARTGDNPSDITRTRQAAVEADRAAGIAWDDAEVARRAYWRHRATAQEKKVVDDCVPMLVQLAAYTRFAGLPAIPPEHVLRQHLVAPQAHVEPAGEVSIEPLPASELDRADDEIIAGQPPLRSRFSRSGHRIK
ncbi:MAG: hypothetical protein Q8L39_10620 [Burkholderiales bacterium]|nr:hypothetical protein [Burkholderiales bacterium]